MTVRLPDEITVLAENGDADAAVDCVPENGALAVSAAADKAPLCYIKLRWVFPDNFLPDGELKVLGDKWERAYGDLEWRSVNPDVFMPWYVLVSSGLRTLAFGVKVRPAALCFWQLDNDGITLWLDIRNGGGGLVLNGRKLRCADVVFASYSGVSAYRAHKAFCGLLCGDPIFPPYPVYGSNNWYYAYGKSSHQEILRDADIIAGLTDGFANRPFMVIDDGWQKNPCDGPWDDGNEKFPDMALLASEIKRKDVRPGIWYRPLADVRRGTPGVSEAMRLPRDPSFLDPSHPSVLELAARDVSRLAGWGYELIKHDYSTFDIFGAWGFLREKTLAGDEKWNFYDKTKTSAEIILEFYKTLLKNAGDALIMGCNTVSHLCAGLVHINRTGDDTSGKDWLRTRKFGVNTLAFRMAQHNVFYTADADCAGITELVPWEKNLLWLTALSVSGTPLFVSCKPGILGAEQTGQLRDALRRGSEQKDVFEPADWTSTTCPSKWILNGEKFEIDWF